MKVLVVGGGAREHALVWKLAAERDVSEVVCAPGNAGIARLARCVPADPGDPDALLRLTQEEHVDLTVIGPELPLARGAADRFQRAGRPLVGPTRAAARLESSKAFAKDFMNRHGIPTARYRVARSLSEALDVAARQELGWPLVVKADGLAAGKGVVVAANRGAAEAAARAAMIDEQFGEAGATLVLEEFLEGVEVSAFVVTDGHAAAALPSAQDHKRVFDDDQGPNTGGMGAFAPSPLVDRALHDRVMREIVVPVLEGMREEGCPYSGFLYAGLMLTADGPRVVEFNVRLGDPEAQVVLPMLESDLLPLLMASAAGGIARVPCHASAAPHVGVVMASGGYPGAGETGKPIAGLEEAERLPDALVFHAGTARRDDRIVTSGGRVLTVVGRGADYGDAMGRAYAAVRHIAFEGMHFRTDIGKKALAAHPPR